MTGQSDTEASCASSGQSPSLPWPRRPGRCRSRSAGPGQECPAGRDSRREPWSKTSSIRSGGDWHDHAGGHCEAFEPQQTRGHLHPPSGAFFFHGLDRPDRISPLCGKGPAGLGPRFRFVVRHARGRNGHGASPRARSPRRSRERTERPGRSALLKSGPVWAGRWQDPPRDLFPYCFRARHRPALRQVELFGPVHHDFRGDDGQDSVVVFLG